MIPWAEEGCRGGGGECMGTGRGMEDDEEAGEAESGEEENLRFLFFFVFVAVQPVLCAGCCA